MNIDAAKSRLIPWNTAPMDDFLDAGEPEPPIALIFEMDLETQQKEISLKYSKVAKIKGLSDRTSFENEMSKIINGSTKLDWQKPERKPDPDAGQGNNRTKDTHLSLNAEAPLLLYLVFKLSDNWQWQFSSDFYPFMISSDDAGKHIFVDAKRFDSGGNIAAFPGKIVEGSRYAFFIWNGTNLPSSPDFQHRFNIHLEFLEMAGTSVHSKIPIIVDPDVRHPGGTGGP